MKSKCRTCTRQMLSETWTPTVGRSDCSASSNLCLKDLTLIPSCRYGCARDHRTECCPFHSTRRRLIRPHVFRGSRRSSNHDGLQWSCSPASTIESRSRRSFNCVGWSVFGQSDRENLPPTFRNGTLQHGADQQGRLPHYRRKGRAMRCLSHSTLDGNFGCCWPPN